MEHNEEEEQTDEVVREIWILENIEVSQHQKCHSSLIKMTELFSSRRETLI